MKQFGNTKFQLYEDYEGSFLYLYHVSLSQRISVFLLANYSS